MTPPSRSSFTYCSLYFCFHVSSVLLMHLICHLSADQLSLSYKAHGHISSGLTWFLSSRVLCQLTRVSISKSQIPRRKVMIIHILVKSLIICGQEKGCDHPFTGCQRRRHSASGRAFQLVCHRLPICQAQRPPGPPRRTCSDLSPQVNCFSHLQTHLLTPGGHSNPIIFYVFLPRKRWGNIELGRQAVWERKADAQEGIYNIKQTKVTTI